MCSRRRRPRRVGQPELPFPPASCRVKRLEQKDELETEKSAEERERLRTIDDNRRMREEIEAYYQKYEAIRKFAQEKGIALPPELEHDVPRL